MHDTQINKRPAGVVAFDLDGTLIRGIRHSWSLLWKAIGTDRSEAIRYQKAFAAGEIDYKQWVRHDFEALRRGGITREKIGDAVRGSHCTLAKNLTAAIGKLRSRGYVTAIISGGVDAVLRCLLNSPEALFDVVYINRLVWGEDGQLREIIPTEYDWDPAKKGVMGKCEGLRRICRDFGVTLEDSVFVGNDENDLMAMRIAGRKVCFSAQGEGLAKQVENVHFEPRNDLMLVADYVLGG